MKRVNRLGFGLAELLVAIALFITGFVILLGVLTSSTHAVKHGQDRIYALQMAQQIVELWRSKKYAAVTVGTQSDSCEYRYRTSGQEVTLTYAYDVDVTVPNTTASPPLKHVRVTVEYPIDSSRNGTVSLETAVADLTQVVSGGGTTGGGTGSTPTPTPTPPPTGSATPTPTPTPTPPMNSGMS